ncbi:hypothetical protein, partial [Stenotrophomonas sp.]|uniref:hypothetical protein n=1 Tax=Stenotrophomonas sp. TaxID=69392 RepID=UPI002FC775F0
MAARLGFTHGAVLHRERLYIGGVALELEAQDVPHALLFSRHADTLEPWSVAYRLAGLAAIRHHGVDT